MDADIEKKRKYLDSLFWGAAILWAGLVFGADRLGVLPQIGDADEWSWILLGMGVYALLGGIWRMNSETYPDPTNWDWIWAGIFLILGIGGFATIDISWPLILILIGGIMLVNTIRSDR